MNLQANVDTTAPGAYRAARDGRDAHRIVYVCTEYPGFIGKSGGIAVSIREEARWFAARGYDVTVLCQTGQSRPGHYADAGVKIEVLPVCGVPKVRAAYDRLLVSRRVRHHLGSHRGVVVSQDYSGPFLAKGFRQPLIVQLHGSATLYMVAQERRITPKDGWFEKRTLHLANGIQAYSEFIARQTDELFDLRQTPVWITPHPVNCETFVPEPAAVNPHELLFTGSLTSRKGLATLAAAVGLVFQARPEPVLTVIGADHEENGISMRQAFLDRVPAVFHPRITFTGQLPRAAVASHMRRAGVFVLPTLVEAFGLVVVEAMASGRPVVASNRASIPEIVRHGVTGLLADPLNPTAFANAILDLVSHPERAHRMGEAARAVVAREYTPDRAYERIAAFHRVLLTPRAPEMATRTHEPRCTPAS
jgi:glycosyltransferase involved in cell wall biosynthesis